MVEEGKLFSIKQERIPLKESNSRVKIHKDIISVSSCFTSKQADKRNDGKGEIKCIR